MTNARRISDELDQRLDTLPKNALELHVQANKHADEILKDDACALVTSRSQRRLDIQHTKKKAPIPCTSKTNLRWRALIFQTGQYSGAMEKHGPAHVRYRTDGAGYKTID
ncbi:hypothetical protein VE00_03253 [Pseudogymnoascus sp. WSF 3629]|nr:hypothetical protein VE00_03253 [Pseudogymnoascus sp. WSF 3629]